MSRPRVGVSADAFVAVVRAYADRVHDDVRRLGCSPAEAAEVVEASALGLAEKLRTRPHEVPDLVGAWFRDARVIADRVGSGVEPEDLVSGEAIVQRSEDDAAARQALTELGERDRVALLLRDAYDLPYLSAGVALGLDQDATATVVARARVRFLRLAGGEAPDDPAPDHDAELATAARLVDGQLPPDAVGAAERHVARCPVCAPLVPAMREARRLLSGLAILAMADPDRDALIARADAVARRHLPTAAEVAAAGDAREPRTMPPLALVAGCLGGAFVLGAMIALAGGDTSLTGRAAPTFEAEPTATTSPTTSSPTPTATRSRTPSPTPTFSPTPTPTPTFSPTPTPTPTFAWRVGGESLAANRTSGENGGPVGLHGRGWAPGRAVRIVYLNALGGETGQEAHAVPDARGEFRAEIVAFDPQRIPGPHTIRATNAIGQSEDIPYTATA